MLGIQYHLACQGKLSIKFGSFNIVDKGQLSNSYNEIEVANYMKGEKIDITVDLNNVR